jgi:cellulose 1,4-beta-cellobiosidase
MYQMFKLKGKEFTFDVDVSNMPCGLNGALYFVEMAADGGKSKYPSNAAGAKYGTGYCDAQCPHDLKWINGEANSEAWEPSPDDPNSGGGKYGTCCIEMDIWEANKISSAYTPHVCTVQGQTRCSGNECGDGDNRYNGVCDKDGCDLNTYRMGVKDFYGPGSTVDTSKKLTVVTQFITTGDELTEIRRIWVQNGKVIQTPNSSFQGLTAYHSVTDKFCADAKQLFGDKNDFATKGGLKAMGAALDRGMVLVMSLWDDHAAHMLWLDSNYPTTADASKPGIGRGTCATSSGVPKDVEEQSPNSSVTFSNIKWGDLNTTFTAMW